jgi:hypothetical protein
MYRTNSVSRTLLFVASYFVGLLYDCRIALLDFGDVRAGESVQYWDVARHYLSC